MVPFYFLVGPPLLLCMIVGALLLFSARYRYLSAHLILGSIFGVIGSVTLPVLSSVLFLFYLKGSEAVSYEIYAFLACGVLGLSGGILVGIITAKRLNQALGWHPEESPIISSTL